jgi:sialic acid synthase SpsE
MNSPGVSFPTDIFSPTYFIADIAANHDGSLERAKKLIALAAKSGANAAKFQNFRASTIVSKNGFIELGEKLSHQSKWEKDVFDVYKSAEVPLDWTDTLIKTCNDNGIDYFTTPYDLKYIEFFNNKMSYFKIGSGDITWKQSLDLIAKLNKPILLATGASELWEVQRSVDLLLKTNSRIILMQCNTNYTGNEDNFDYLNLSVISQYRKLYPNILTGFSDHSIGHIPVLGAVALGAKVIEKHFTDDSKRIGPDHSFSLDPIQWKEMVNNTRILERSLGDGHKKVELNEIDAQIVQRRAIRYIKNLNAGDRVLRQDLIALRPCPLDGIDPFDIEDVVGKKLKFKVCEDQLVRKNDFELS